VTVEAVQFEKWVSELTNFAKMKDSQMKTLNRRIFEEPFASEANYYTHPAHPRDYSYSELEFEWKTGTSTCNSSLDAKAQSIIQVAQRSTIDFQWRAFQVVWRIIGEYYPSDVSKVSAVVWKPKLFGLETKPDRFAPTGVIYGQIFVGEDFVSNTNERHFARRVLQVGHELQHIDQHRKGIANRDEREFLAFHWASMAQEKPGTGCLQHAMRRDLIDCTIGYLNCLPSADQQKYTQERSDLLNRRISVNGTRGNPPTNPPSTCQRCNP
jgi:hypothetical protein